ncbi:hypothetical protein [Spirillospora sp. CA-128828]
MRVIDIDIADATRKSAPAPHHASVYEPSEVASLFRASIALRDPS